MDFHCASLQAIDLCGKGAAGSHLESIPVVVRQTILILNGLAVIFLGSSYGENAAIKRGIRSIVPGDRLNGELTKLDADGLNKPRSGYRGGRQDRQSVFF